MITLVKPVLPYISIPTFQLIIRHPQSKCINLDFLCCNASTRALKKNCSCRKNTVKSGLNVIVNNNVFTYNNRVYKQNNGAPMGFHCFKLLTEFILRPLVIMIRETLRPCPDFWFRYVDDVFIIWRLFRIVQLMLNENCSILWIKLIYIR